MILLFYFTTLCTTCKPMVILQWAAIYSLKHNLNIDFALYFLFILLYICIMYKYIDYYWKCKSSIYLPNKVLILIFLFVLLVSLSFNKYFTCAAYLNQFFFLKSLDNDVHQVFVLLAAKTLNLPSATVLLMVVLP